MEVNKTKKRLATGDVEAEVDTNALKKLNKGEQEEGASATGGSGAGNPAAAPTEEEVEEFFAILRRMKVAVDYFDQKGRGGKEWREVLEQAEFTVDDDGDDGGGDGREADGAAVKESTGQEVIVNESFDLNAVAPEAADASA